MKKIRIRPIGPHSPINPKTNKPLEGETEVEQSTYWRRRLLEGCIEIVPSVPLVMTVQTTQQSPISMDESVDLLDEEENEE